MSTTTSSVDPTLTRITAKPQQLPGPHSPWCPFTLSLIGNQPRAEVKELGLTPDMVIPIFPNTQYSRPGREPVRPLQPFPFPNCFHWYCAHASARIRSIPEGYDKDIGIRLNGKENIGIQSKFSSDYDQVVSRNKVVSEKAAGPAADARQTDARHSLGDTPESLTNTSDGPAGSPARLTDAPDTVAVPSHFSPCTPPRDGTPSAASPICSASSLPISFGDCGESDAGSLADIVRDFDIFGMNPNPEERFVPLVDIWMSLDAHFTAETITSPVEWYREARAIRRSVLVCEVSLGTMLRCLVESSRILSLDWQCMEGLCHLCTHHSLTRRAWLEVRAQKSLSRPRRLTSGTSRTPYKSHSSRNPPHCQRARTRARGSVSIHIAVGCGILSVYRSSTPTDSSRYGPGCDAAASPPALMLVRALDCVSLSLL